MRGCSTIGAFRKTSGLTCSGELPPPRQAGQTGTGAGTSAAPGRPPPGPVFLPMMAGGVKVDQVEPTVVKGCRKGEGCGPEASRPRSKPLGQLA